MPVGQPRTTAADSLPGRVGVSFPTAHQQPTGPGVGTRGTNTKPAREHVPPGQRVVERRVRCGVVVKGGRCVRKGGVKMKPCFQVVCR